MIPSRCASAACANDRKGADRKRTMGGEKKECLVGLIAGIVDRSTAHPSDLAEFLALVSSKNFKCGSICIDKSVVVFVPIIGLLRIRMERGAI
jgi:hypothetical protein